MHESAEGPPRNSVSSVWRICTSHLRNAVTVVLMGCSHGTGESLSWNSEKLHIIHGGFLLADHKEGDPGLLLLRMHSDPKRSTEQAFLMIPTMYSDAIQYSDEGWHRSMSRLLSKVTQPQACRPCYSVVKALMQRLPASVLPASNRRRLKCR